MKEKAKVTKNLKPIYSHSDYVNTQIDKLFEDKKKLAIMMKKKSIKLTFPPAGSGSVLDWL